MILSLYSKEWKKAIKLKENSNQVETEICQSKKGVKMKKLLWGIGRTVRAAQN